MRIYQMTATFGKLDHQTLTLKPGLNIITAPNEWGKSTWCAFLVAMLYGIDTRTKTTKNALADKEHYAPWSGQPMEGRIDLNWNGRDITIERRTRRRVPMGEFSAFETKTGLPVPELTAANCGQVLLGVEQSVFRRSSFIRQADLPVTVDEALRRRLNALVTTGNENDAADRMADTLKDLRNRCRYNHTGLLPQAEAERDALESRLTELESLNAQCQTLRVRIEELKAMIAQLKNHRQTLDYAAAQEHAQRVETAKKALDAAQAQREALDAACSSLPSHADSQEHSAQLRELRAAWNALQAEQDALPDPPEKPSAPAPFTDMSIDDARQMLREDTQRYVTAKHRGAAVLLVVMGILGLLCSGLLLYLKATLFAGIAGVGSLIALVWGMFELIRSGIRKGRLRKKYGTSDQTRWPLPLAEYERHLNEYMASFQEYHEASSDIQSRFDSLQKELDRICGTRSPEEALDGFDSAISTWERYYAATREVERTQSHLDALNAMTKPVEKPMLPDTLTHSSEETDRLLRECSSEQQRLENRLNQYQGHMASLGNAAQLQSQLTQKVKRIAKLEKTYAALIIAQDTLAKAKEELQRRFAPKITKRAQKWMAQMTGGRYQSVTMDTEFSLRASTDQEGTLRDILWRSDGTIDQLYLALRLSVAEELTPQAPLVLDDALVRFDDQRMKAALSILNEISQHKQVIVFTCQSREGAL